jgi:hypothetical protein
MAWFWYGRGVIYTAPVRTIGFQCKHRLWLCERIFFGVPMVRLHAEGISSVCGNVHVQRQNKPSQAKPSQTKPTQAKPTQAKTIKGLNNKRTRHHKNKTNTKCICLDLVGAGANSPGFRKERLAPGTRKARG